MCDIALWENNVLIIKAVCLNEMKRKNSLRHAY